MTQPTPSIPVFEVKNLYTIERYTDLQAGEIIRHTPVLETGERDPMRQEFFIGQTMAHTNHGPIQISFQLEATSISEAISKWTFALQGQLAQMQSNALRNQIMQGVGKPAGNSKRS